MVEVFDALVVKQSAGTSKDPVRRALVLAAVTLFTVGACADSGPRHLAPPPRPLDTAAISAGPGPSAFAGALAAPPELAFPATTDPDDNPGRAAGRAKPDDPARTWPAGAASSSPAFETRSMLTQLGVAAAPFSSHSGNDLAAAPASPEPDLAGAGPTRTAMRVRPITAPFSGPRPAAAEPLLSPPPEMAHAEPPPAPFIGTRSAREILRDTTPVKPPMLTKPAFAEPTVSQADLAEAADPRAEYAPPPAFEYEPPVAWAGRYTDTPSPVTESGAGADPAFEHPMFVSAAEAYATVIVSNGGVEVVADEAGRDNLRFAALPADPGGWATGRLESDMAADLAEAPAAAPAAPAGEMIATLLFDDGGVDIGEAERQILREVARIQQIDNRMMTLVGHASGRTRADNAVAQQRTNMRISRRRAESAVRALATFGVPRSRMQITAMGDTQPRYAEVMAAGEAGNRRVEVYLAD